MNLYCTITSERASESQGGNDFINVELTVNRIKVGEIELYYSHDTDNHQKLTDDEWVLKFRPDETHDWEIIAQGNISPLQRCHNHVGWCAEHQARHEIGKRQKGDIDNMGPCIDRPYPLGD